MGYAKTLPCKLLKCAWYAIKRPSDVPEGDGRWCLVVMGSFNDVQYANKSHVCTLVQSVTMLRRVKDIIRVPDQVDTPGNGGCPDFPDHFI